MTPPIDIRQVALDNLRAAEERFWERPAGLSFIRVENAREDWKRFIQVLFELADAR